MILARSLCEVGVEQFDADPWLLNVANGTIDLRTGELREHRREDLLTKLCPVPFDPDATCPTFEGFLDRILPDPEVHAFVQRAVGYALTGSTREQVLFILWGGGANGKTTLVEALLAVLGDYGLMTPTDTIAARRETSIPNDVARLRGARFVGAIETDENRRLAEARVKQLTGSDTISARHMRAEWFDFKMSGKLFLATNHKPVIRGTDYAIWRRIRLVPFTITIPDDEKDGALPDKLLAEAPGILRWAVDGCAAWQHEGLGAPEAVSVATDDYRTEQDVLGEFIRDCCSTHPDASCTAAELYDAFADWHGGRPMNKKTFGLRLQERGFEPSRRYRDGRQQRCWDGIGLGQDT